MSLLSLPVSLSLPLWTILTRDKVEQPIKKINIYRQSAAGHALPTSGRKQRAGGRRKMLETISITSCRSAQEAAPISDRWKRKRTSQKFQQEEDEAN